jgi:GT2 family glycosyltransferase
MHIVALTTCHNRRALTLRSLADLHAQILPEGVTLLISIVDDGSSDGTGDAIRSAFPDVNIINGNGGLYWAGGMRYGWDQWVKHQEFDALLVYNDDIRLNTNAIQELIATSRHARSVHGELVAVSGAFTDTDGQVVTYGGYRQTSKWHRLRFSMVQPIGTPCQIDTLNMNCALISAQSLREVGFLSHYFRHGGADMEFGIRLCKAGGSIWLTSSAIGTCERNETENTSNREHIGYRELYRLLFGIKGEPPSIRARYFRDHGGILWPILWAGPYLRFMLKIIGSILLRR